jgi:serine phosphatase RsbU (regulator of sigma subunit)
MHALAFPYTADDGVTSLYDLAVSRVGEGLLVVWRDVTDRERERAAAAHADAVRASSEQLQRGLLPPPPPDVAGLRFAATYRPATETAEVGGDWYDAVTVTAGPDAGAVDVVVGDVEGHDGEAAALMARLSSVIRADSRRGADVETIIRDLEVFHAGLGTERLASVVIARLRPDDGGVVVASAGHPLPLVVQADGTTVAAPVTTAPPLGAGGVAPTAASVQLDRGDTLLLFSDGLLDPGLDPDEALARIIAAIATCGVEDLQRLTDELAGGTRGFEPSDDVVVMAVTRLASG